LECHQGKQNEPRKFSKLVEKSIKFRYCPIRRQAWMSGEKRSSISFKPASWPEGKFLCTYFEIPQKHGHFATKNEYVADDGRLTYVSRLCCRAGNMVGFFRMPEKYL